MPLSLKTVEVRFARSTIPEEKWGLLLGNFSVFN